MENEGFKIFWYSFKYVDREFQATSNECIHLPKQVKVEAKDEDGEGQTHVDRNKAGGGEHEEDDVEGGEDHHHEQHRVDGKVPPEVARPNVEEVNDLEYDQLEHGAGEAEVDAEDELDHPVVELVVFEEHLNEEDPAKEEESKLTCQDHYWVVEQLHYGKIDLTERCLEYL